MKRYLSIFNFHTAIVVAISVMSSAVCVYFKLSLYIDFLILGLMVVFPLTFSLTAAFKRRERALQYISLFKASLQSAYYVFRAAAVLKNSTVRSPRNPVRKYRNTIQFPHQPRPPQQPAAPLDIRLGRYMSRCKLSGGLTVSLHCHV